MYYGTDDLDEAYYLCAIFNSKILDENLSRIKSSRHIMKRLVEFPIPKYNENNKYHRKLAELSRTCEKILKDNADSHEFSKTKMLELIKNQMIEIDNITQLLMVKE
jgi:hypothetical protein